MEKINIIYKPIKDLKEYENNPRKNEEAIEYVANSIKEFGFKSPILIDKNNIIIAGHTRKKACEKLGIKEAPCIIIDDLTDEQIKAFRLADNKVSEIATWDFDMLNEELDAISNFDMSDFSFVIFNEKDINEDFKDFEDIGIKSNEQKEIIETSKDESIIIRDTAKDDVLKENIIRVVCPDCGKEFFI